MRLIDADALEREYRGQFDSVYKNIRDSVNPADFYLERKASYDKKLVKLEMEAFFEYLHNRPTIDAVPVVRCKDCKYRQTDNCPMYHEDWFDYDDGYGYYTSDLIIKDMTKDEGFCYFGARMDGEADG